MKEIRLLAEFSSSDTAIQVIFIGCLGLDFQVLTRESGAQVKENEPDAKEASRPETKFGSPWNQVPISTPYDSKMTQSFIKRWLFSPFFSNALENNVEIKLRIMRKSNLEPCH